MSAPDSNRGLSQGSTCEGPGVCSQDPVKLKDYFCPCEVRRKFKATTSGH